VLLPTGAKVEVGLDVLGVGMRSLWQMGCNEESQPYQKSNYFSIK
jgi:hypothetical protein